MRQAQRMQLILIVLSMLSLPSLAGAQCLLCILGFQPAAGHGPVSSTDNRRKISIHIDGSWGNPTPAKLWNAVQEAVNGWNNATDGGWHTGYYFEVTQNHELGYPSDITIKADASCPGGAPGCLDFDHANPAPAQMLLSMVSINSTVNTQADAAALVMHEMAHFMGISRKTCGSESRYDHGRDALSDRRLCDQHGPTAADVAMANQALNNPGGCTDPRSNASIPNADPPVDSGGGGEETYQEPTYYENETQYECDVHYWRTDYYVLTSSGWRYWYSDYEYMYYDNCHPLECCEDD